MKLTSLVSFALVSIIVGSLSFKSQAETAAPVAVDFIAGYDSAITLKNDKAPTGRALVIDRYYAMLSRASIFALYCDWGNKRGESTAIRTLTQRALRFEKEATKMLGGLKYVDIMYDSKRNIESARFTANVDRAAVCAVTQATFDYYKVKTADQLENLFLTTPFGQL